MKDIPALSELAARIWRTHYAPHIVSSEQIEYMLPRVCSPASLARAMEEKSQRFWLACVKDKIVGYIAAEPKSNGQWFIDKLYVDQAQQRSGAGEMLLNHVISILKPKRLDLRVNRKNIQAINFYFKHGFVIEALNVLDIGEGYVMDDFLMKKIV